MKIPVKSKVSFEENDTSELFLITNNKTRKLSKQGKNYFITNNLELWRDVKNYEGLYKISNFGKIRSLRRNKILKASINHHGYYRIGLTKNSKQTNFFIARLVGIAFIPNPLGLPEINHKNEERKDNHCTNLEWCTSKYNSNYGERCNKIAKKIYQYDLNYNLVKIWTRLRETNEYGFNSSAISKCCTKKIKKYKGYIWSHIPLTKTEIF